MGYGAAAIKTSGNDTEIKPAVGEDKSEPHLTYTAKFIPTVLHTTVKTKP